MLLLAHLGRAEVPPSLQADLKFVLKKAPQLLEEMITIANWPRTHAMTGWLTPTVGCLEMAQCITQALGTSSRKLLGQGGAKVGSPLACCAGRPLLRSHRKLTISVVQDCPHVARPTSQQGRQQSDSIVSLTYSFLNIPTCNWE